MPGDRPVPRDSPTYQEFARLYYLAQRMSGTTVDRWNGNLYATDDELMGGFKPKSGDMRLSDERVLRHLTGAPPRTTPSARSEAIATVLHESTHAGLATDAPGEPNAVRSSQSVGLMEGVAEVHAMENFEAFAERAGYPDLPTPIPTYPGAYAATSDLLSQVTGPAMTRRTLLDEAIRGPGVMHFDQFANAAVQNRLRDVVPDRAADQQAVRAALISTMTHVYWPTIQHRPASAGESLGNEIRQHLNAKIDEIRQHYSPGQTQPFPAESPNQLAVQAAQPAAQSEAPKTKPDAEAAAPARAGTSTAPEMRFLTGLAPAAGATRKAPSLGQGQKGAGSNHRGPTTERELD